MDGATGDQIYARPRQPVEADGTRLNPLLHRKRLAGGGFRLGLGRRGASFGDPAACDDTLARDGRPQFIHSGTYEQLLDAFGLSAERIAQAILDKCASS